VILHGVLVLLCVVKGKYRLALIGLLVPVLAVIGAVRMARPRSIWARRRYEAERMAAAERRSDAYDARWGPWLTRWDNLVGGAPSRPDPGA